jgi:type VI secretion system protein VasG
MFKPAFLGRMVVVPYLPISPDALREIIQLKLGSIKRRIQQNHGITLTCDDALVAEVKQRCTEVESGARNVDNILTNTLLPEISRELLGRMAQGEKFPSLHVTVGTNGAFAYRWTEATPPAEMIHGADKQAA